jgi:hypothetical protein
MFVAAPPVTRAITRFHLVPRVRRENYPRKRLAARLTFQHAKV